MRKNVKTLFPLTLLSTAVLYANPIAAQDQVVALEEVIVTAQRREQNLQDVPVSVTAFTGDSLARSNIRSATEYLALTPNVSFTEDGSSGKRGLGISIRGVNNLVTDENAFVNSVGVYLDEFSVASVPNGVANPQVPDMERIEILRGPQGTYFGRNSLGGALNITTKKPVDEFEGEIKVGAESYEDAGDSYNITGILNIPVTDNFALRGVYMYEDSDGYVDNACSSGAGAAACPGAAENNFIPNGNDSDHEYSMFRLNALWDMSEDTTILATVIYTDEEQGADENVPSGVLDLDTVDGFGLANDGAVDPGTGFWGDQYDTLSHDRPEENTLESTVGILNVQHRLGDTATIKWISGFIDSEKYRFFDNDLLGGLDIIYRDTDWTADSWSTELRFEISEERYDFTAGILYAEDEHEQDSEVTIGTNPTATINGQGFFPPFPEGLRLASVFKEFEVESIAAFADYTWHATEKLDFIVGARYTEDEITNTLLGEGFAPTACGPGTPGFPFTCFENFFKVPVENTEDFDDVSPRFVVRYQVTDDINVYGTVSKGYKAGGTSLGYLGDDPIVEPYDEESLWNYEIGFKSELWDNRLRLNASIFFLEWEDLQLESFRFLIPGDLNSNFEKTINVEKAEATGIEFEFLAAITENFSLRGGAGFLDTEITKSETAEITGGFVVELEGRDIPKSPEFTANLVAEYRYDVGDGEGWVQLEFVHRDGQYSDVEGLTYKQTDGPSPNQGLARGSIANHGDFPFRSPDYDVWNLRTGLDLKSWSIALYVQNLDEENYYTGTQENFGLSGFRLRPHPRTIGGSIAYRF
jgi:iron complex outermembrane recepter protein